MNRTEFLNIQSKYSFLQDRLELYRKELLDFINDAFAKHGGQFELNTDCGIKWAERSKNTDFDAINELPYYLLIGVEDDNSHEIHINKIKQITTDFGYNTIEVDGFDWSENDWVYGLDAYYDIESLTTISSFINGVLEQEYELYNE